LKGFIVFFAFLLLLQFAAAKEIAVVFNFPAGSHADVVERLSLPEDANAFNAFSNAAAVNSLDLNLSYWGDSLGWFVNGINGLNNNWPAAYWHFWVNGSEAQTGISAFVPADNDTIELGYEAAPLDANSIAFERAIDWLVSNQKASGEIGVHAVWGNAFALQALSLADDENAVKQKAIDYLLSNQYDNAGFGYPGFGADVGHSAIVTMALLSNGKTLLEFDKNNVSTIDFVSFSQQSDGGFSSWGASDIDSTAWATIALIQSGNSLPAKDSNTPVSFILASQNADGGFGYNKQDSSKEDYTAEALLALKAANYSTDSKISNAIAFLNAKKNAGNCLSSSYTTALAIIALNAWNEQYSSMQGCLKSLQLADGGFSRNATSNSVDTALAAIALKGKTLPLSVSSVDNNGLIPLNSIIKFSVKIKNSGKIKASNVSISLQGLPADWVDIANSTMSFASILPGETKTATIFAAAKSAGNFSVRALVSAAEAQQATSNSLGFETAQAVLEASISLE